MRPVVLLRADGGSNIGLGHITRCIALAQMIQADFDITFYCAAIPAATAALMVDLGFTCVKIKNESDFIKKISGNEIVVMDGYHFDSAYQKIIKEKGAILVCIDDLHDKEYFADLIINHAPATQSDVYKIQPYTTLALGLEYALLRPAFLEEAKSNDDRNAAISKALICFGGADPKNISKDIYNLIKADGRFQEIIMVTGSAYTFNDELEEHLQNEPSVKWHRAIDEAEMLRIMKYVDVAFVPSSGILMEVLASGALAVSGYYIDNQKHIYAGFKDAGAIIDAGDFSNEYFAANNVLNKIFSNETVGKHIDGKSGDRIRKLFRILYYSNKMHLRRATENDLQTTFKWASDERIRAFSFQKHKISFEEHSNWFLKKVLDPTCEYFIAELNDEPVGSIRFDMKSNEAVISYLIDGAFHGKGLGQFLLSKGMIALKDALKGDDIKCVGFVEENNLSSIRIFENLGFKKIQENAQFRFEQNI